MKKIFIFDTTLRDGEQSPGASLNSDEKLEIARQLKKLNVDVIEAGFPVSSRGDFEAVSAIAQEIKGPVICALARAVEADINRANEALKHAEKPMIHTFIGTSDLQVFDVLKKTREQVIEMAVKAVKLAKSYCQEVEFSAMDASRTDYNYLREVVMAAIEAGATVINIPDTAGYAIPEEFACLINKLSLTVPNLNGLGRVRLSVHCHDDLGLAVANSLVAIQEGASQIECAVNGVGERAGNAALEEVVMAIKTRGDYLEAYTDIKTQEIINTSRLVSRLSGFFIPPNKPVVGSNAFVHSSGIHQDGVLKERTTFEIMQPKDVGLFGGSEIVLTARSGRHALQHRLSQLGYKLTKEQLETAYRRFLELADKKKEVYDEDLRAIIDDQIIEAETPQGSWSLHFCSYAGKVGVNHSGERAMAEVALLEYRTIHSEKGWGDGPIDAVFDAINRIIGVKPELLHFSIEPATKGQNAIGEATVRIKDDDGVFTGRGASTDTIEAAAKAYINAINKMLVAKEK